MLDSVELTEAAIVKILRICEEIAALKQELPAAPEGCGFAEELEIARQLRPVMAQHSASLIELRDILAHKS